MRKSFYCLVCILIIIAACAHKAKPLFKDRMKPKLTRARAMNNRYVQLSFSEEIDTLSFSIHNITLHADADTLAILLMYPTTSTAEIMCLTEPQSAITYRATGIVADTAQNMGSFSYAFEGTLLPDTLAPYVTHYSRGSNHHEFFLAFSEAMDTTRTAYHVLPGPPMDHAWQDLRTCRITPQEPVDSLQYNTTYYLYTDGGFSDISDNLLSPFITSITPDTVYEPYVLKGEVSANDTLVTEGIALLRRAGIHGIAFINNGLFTFEVRDKDAFMIEALCNGYYGSDTAWSDSTNVIPVFASEKTIDSIIR